MSIQTPTKESQEAMQAKTQAVPPMNVGGGLPEGGTVGQVLTKTATGAEWDDVPEELPEGGTTGQVLTKTASGSEWANAAAGGIPKFAVTFTTNEYLIDEGGETQPVADFQGVNLTLSGDFPSVYNLGTQVFALEVTIRDGNNKEFCGLMFGRLAGTSPSGTSSKYMMRLTGTLAGAFSTSQGKWGIPNSYIIENAVLYVNRTISPFTYKYWGKVTGLDG